MKKLRGFTLAELLLCIGIIGIVTAMGVTITKMSTDQAYKLYLSEGYNNLYMALPEAVKNEGNNPGAAKLASELAKVFDKTASASSFTTSNGITYTVDSYDGKENYIITMTVPQAKKRGGSGKISTRFFLTKSAGGFLVPLDVSGSGFISLQDNESILPFYIARGLNQNDSNQKITKMSYKNAVCSATPIGRKVVFNDNAQVPNADSVWYQDGYITGSVWSNEMTVIDCSQITFTSVGIVKPYRK